MQYDYHAETLPLACSLNADELNVRDQELADFFTGIEQIQELPDGYALRFPGTPSWSQRVFTFVQGERSCCLFFTFEMIFLANRGAIWLHVRGAAGVKELFANMLCERGVTLI